jgi:hypothetical protein
VRSAGILLVAVLAGCDGGWHVRKEQQVLSQVAVGIPSSDGDLFWAGEDEPAPNVAGGVGYARFVRDRFALLGTLAYRYYDQVDGPVHAAEFQFGMRYFLPLEFRLAQLPIGFFVDANVGVMQSSRSVPEEGSDTNVVQEAGGGVEAILGDRTSLLLGWHQRHTSWGGGNVPHNPGYNDHQVFLAFAWRW